MCVRLKRRAAMLAAILFALFMLALCMPRRAVPAGTGMEVRVPIIMYHSVSEDAGRACEYIISQADFRSDMEYLARSGYTAVSVSDLCAFENGIGSLPEKCVVITFDDGCLNFLTLAAPILREYGMKAVVSVVGEYTDEYARSGDRNPNYAYLSWDDIRAIADSGIAEIGNHSYAMHSLGARRGCMKMAGEDDNTYREALKSDLSRLQTELAEKSGVRPEVFTYPYGLISGQSLPVIRGLGFAAALTCEEKVNVLTGNPDELYSLGRFNRPAGISTEQFMARVLKLNLPRRS